LLFFGTQIDNYFTGRFFNRISTSVAVVVVVAIGQTLVLLTRNVDLSVGSIVGFSAYLVGSQLAINQWIPPWLAVVIAIAAGASMGLLNGVLVAYGRVPAIITTLGTMAIYRTLMFLYSDSKTVTADSMPPWVMEVPRANVASIGELDLRVLVLLALLVVIVFQFVLSYTSWGRRLYAIGSNPDAAKGGRHSGATHGDDRLHPLRRVGRRWWVHVPVALRQHHRGGRRKGWNCKWWPARWWVV
jgi:rhamnose transport system permease protein